jgi:hypothetical protein
MTGTAAAAAFSPDVLLAALEQAVTVIGPDDILAVRVPVDLDDDEAAALREGAERIRETYGARILFAAGEEFAKIRAADATQIRDV